MSTVVAFERGAVYSPTPAGDSDDVVGEVIGAVDRALGRRIDELTDEQITSELEVWETIRRRADARLARLARGLSQRRIRRYRDTAEPGDAERAGRRAARDTRRELTGRLNWSPGQAKRADDDGRRLDALPGVGAAADRGELTPRHARVLADTLRYLDGSDRDDLERELIALAATQDPTTFGRTCRRRLGEIDPDALALDHDLKQQRRRATVTKDDDGMLRLEGRWTGLDAETIATAVHAYRRPDTSGQTRTPGQRTADAILELARSALNGADAPTDRGVRPHVNLTIPIQMIREGSGVAEGEWTGPICYQGLRSVLDDVGLAWLVTDEGGLPLEAGEAKRTVPRGLWRVIHQRDRGCIREGCDAPAAWCDVMHLDRSFADGGRLSPDNAALGCRHHHRRFDAGRLELHWQDRRPILRPPDTGSGPDRPRDRPDHGPDRPDRETDAPQHPATEQPQLAMFASASRDGPDEG